MERFAVELRARVEGDTLSGYAAVFGQTAKVGGHYEQLARSAFDRVLADADPVLGDPRFLVNHEPSRLLGRRSSGTLRVEVDERGLGFEVDLPDTEDGRMVRELTRRGDLDGGSFGFLVGADRWERAPDGLQLRTHTDVKGLLDLSVVTYPAYEGASVALRHLTFAPSAGRSRLIRARHRARYTGGREA